MEWLNKTNNGLSEEEWTRWKSKQRLKKCKAAVVAFNETIEKLLARKKGEKLDKKIDYRQKQMASYFAWITFMMAIITIVVRDWVLCKALAAAAIFSLPGEEPALAGEMAQGTGAHALAGC